MKAWLSLASIALVAVWPLQARCEPDATVKWLMDRPVSLFDWGIFRLSRHVAEELKTGRGAEELRKRGIAVHVAFGRYEWNENRLYIQVTAEQAPVTPEACRFVLDVTRNRLVGEEAGKPREVRASYFLDEMFQHEGGYGEKTRPSDLSERLVKITVVRASLGPFLKDVSCFGSLAGTDANIEMTR